MQLEGKIINFLGDSITYGHGLEDVKYRFCDFLCENFGLCDKCMTVGFSCVGMHAIYFASKYPKKVAAMYLDAPVINLLSCPAGVGKGTTEMILFRLMKTGRLFTIC